MGFQIIIEQTRDNPCGNSPIDAAVNREGGRSVKDAAYAVETKHLPKISIRN